MASPRRKRQPEPERLTKLAFGYARFSDLKQNSVEEQLGINETTAALHGLEIIGSFSDEGVSRSIGERPGLIAMFEALKQQPAVGFLVVNELERLTAGVAQRAAIAELCQAQRVTIVTHNQGLIDPFDEAALQRADEAAVKANAEVRTLRDRTRRNLRQKVINGTVAMRPAFGTRMQAVLADDGTPLPPGAVRMERGKIVRSGQLEVHPEELHWLKKIFEWAGEGVSYDDIARRLTAAGVKTKTGKDLWRGNTVSGILSNPLYKGEITWGLQATVRPLNGKKRLEMRPEGDPGIITKPSPLGPLVDVELWESVNAAIEWRRAHRQIAKTPNHPRLFDGKVYCARCGHKMYGRPEGWTAKDGSRRISGYRYYCYSMRPGWLVLPGYESNCSVVNSISEKKILTALSLADFDPLQDLDTLSREVPKDNDVKRRMVQRRIAEAHSKLDKAEDLALDGLISKEKLAATRTQTMAVVSSAEQELQELARQAGGSGRPTKAWLQQAARSLRELTELLLTEELVLDDKLDALRRVGLVRLYVDGPRVQVRLIS